MSGPRQNHAALHTERFVLAQVRASDPATLWVVTELVGKHTFDHKNFFAAKMPMRIEIRIWCPTHHSSVAGAILGQRQNAQAVDHSLILGNLLCINDHALGVCRIKVAQFDQQRAAIFGKRSMSGARWIL